MAHRNFHLYIVHQIKGYTVSLFPNPWCKEKISHLKISLWQVDSFKQTKKKKKTKAQNTQKETLTFPYLPEECIQKTSSRKGAITRGTYSMNLGINWDELTKVCLLKFISVSQIVSTGPSKHLLTKHQLFSSQSMSVAFLSF